MVRDQVAARGIRDAALLDTMRKVPREFFVPPHLAEFAYLDTPLPIESGQTISQPYIVALMIEAVTPRPSYRALEIGTGSGYGAAVQMILADGHTYEFTGSFYAAGKRSLREPLLIRICLSQVRRCSRSCIESRSTWQRK